MSKKFKFNLEELKKEDFKGHALENQVLSTIKGGHKGWCNCSFLDGFADLTFSDMVLVPY